MPRMFHQGVCQDDGNPDTYPMLWQGVPEDRQGPFSRLTVGRNPSLPVMPVLSICHFLLVMLSYRFCQACALSFAQSQGRATAITRVTTPYNRRLSQRSEHCHKVPAPEGPKPLCGTEQACLHAELEPSIICFMPLTSC